LVVVWVVFSASGAGLATVVVTPGIVVVNPEIVVVVVVGVIGFVILASLLVPNMTIKTNSISQNGMINTPTIFFRDKFRN
jgi:hypothetical protein